MRNIIIGTDGTWNKPDQMDRDRQVPSNVVKIIRAVDEQAQSIPQVKYYDTGVGTAGFLDKLWGGTAGSGLFGNMRRAYEWLIENYREGDRLYLFGFSRGAFTVRSLAGMLQVCGIPRIHKGTDAMQLAQRAARIYRTDNDDDRRAAGESFRKQYASAPGIVHFLGVWDTVGALGLPTRGLLGMVTRRRHHFHDVTLGANVRHAYHALAIDEQRRPFEPSLWREPKPEEVETVVQTWFPGVHSNIGGGYVDCGLSDRALYWMVRNAERHGLVINKDYIKCRLDPNWFGELRDSLSMTYRTPLTGLPKLRDIGTGVLGEHIHFSALRRWSSPSRPEEIPDNLRAALAKDLPVDEDRQEREINDAQEVTAQS